MNSMTSLATGHSSGSRQGNLSFSIFIFTKSNSPPPWPPSLLGAESELCFFHTVNSSRGTTFPMYLFLLDIILLPLAFWLGF